MGYDDIDKELLPWVDRHSVKLFTKSAGRDARFFYVSSKLGECFQISVDPVCEFKVRVDAWSVETVDDKDMHEQWIVLTNDINMALGSALKQIDKWMARLS